MSQHNMVLGVLKSFPKAIMLRGAFFYLIDSQIKILWYQKQNVNIL
jgi:hypothetical protein